MPVTEILAKSLVRRQKRPDAWFVASLGMNLYRGCAHDCAYCDGRAERYCVEGRFGQDVAVKVNAPELLRREVDPARRRKPLPGGYLLLGGGVGDSYQPVESRYRLSRRALEVLAEFAHPVEVLTKSTLVLRDLDLLQAINRRRRALVCFSLSSVDEEISRVLEPGVPPPRRRLQAMAALAAAGIPCGLFLLPVIPGLTDCSRRIGDALRQAREAGARFVVFGGMTLKQGRQKDHFLSVLRPLRPELERRYHRLYPPDPWGQARRSYAVELDCRCAALARRAGLPVRMPPVLWSDLVGEQERVLVVLEHVDYLLRLASPGSGATVYGRAARALAAGRAEPQGLLPFASPRPGLPSLDPRAAELVAEVRRTGASGLYDELLGPVP